jgi:hypothetical protein
MFNNKLLEFLGAGCGYYAFSFEMRPILNRSTAAQSCFPGTDNSQFTSNIWQFMSIFKWWRQLYAENPKAVAMLFLGLGIGHVLAGILISRENRAATELPALFTFGIVFVCMSVLYWRRASKFN